MSISIYKSKVLKTRPKPIEVRKIKVTDTHSCTEIVYKRVHCFIAKWCTKTGEYASSVHHKLFFTKEEAEEYLQKVIEQYSTYYTEVIAFLHTGYIEIYNNFWDYLRIHDNKFDYDIDIMLEKIDPNEKSIILFDDIIHITPILRRLLKQFLR